MSNKASFWDKPDTDTTVVRHAPTTNQYHDPDSDQMSRMRGSQVGGFAIVPAANKDGSSKGFDCDVAGVVHVDPDAPGGGYVVDLSAVDKHTMNDAIDTSVYPHEVFSKLSEAPAPMRRSKLTREPKGVPRGNPVMPGSYVVPPSDSSGAQVADNGFQPRRQQERQVPNQPQPAQDQPQPPQQNQQPAGGMPPPYPYYPSPYPPPPQPADPGLYRMVENLAVQVQGLTDQVKTFKPAAKTPPPRAASPASRLRTVPAKREADDGEDEEYETNLTPIGTKPGPKAEEDDEEGDEEDKPGNSLVRRQASSGRRQTVDEFKRAQKKEDPIEGTITGFETLKIPFVSGPVPQKPKFSVVYEYEHGSQQTKYHAVIESGEVVALVYDTRYTDGMQYVPNDLGATQIKIHVKQLKKTFAVSSMGFNFACGVLDVVVLVKHDVLELDYEES